MNVLAQYTGNCEGPGKGLASGPGCRGPGKGSAPARSCGKTTNHLFGTFTAAKERIVHSGRRRATEIMCHGEGFGFQIEDDREGWPPYNPTVEDTDPDGDLVPKDPGNWDWHCNEKKRERTLEFEGTAAKGIGGPGDPSGLLDYYVIPKKQRLV